MDEILNGITNATEYVGKSGSGVVYGLQSSFARFNYRLMDKYLFTFTAVTMVLLLSVLIIVMVSSLREQSHGVSVTKTF